MPRAINLRQIEAFKAVVENGTVVRAAGVLNISQPALSKLIAHLEFDTGLRLFDRVKGRLAPTEQAMRLYDEIGRIFAGVRQVESAVDAIRREEQGRISIGVLPGLAGSFIQRVTSSFLATSGNIFCEIESIASEWIVDRLITRKLDIGLVSARIDNPYIVREPLMDHPIVCIMHPDHPLAAKRIIKAKDLNDVPFIAFQSTDLGMLVDRTLNEHNVRPRVALVSSIAPTVVEFVAAGLGVSLVHPLLVSGSENRVVTRRFESEITYHFQLCHSPDSRNALVVEAFADEARKVAAQISKSLLE